MNGLKEFFGNIPMFQKQVEREIEEKGIEPSEGIKKMEFTDKNGKAHIKWVLLF